ncbi:MAG: DMT family transporter [Xenococcus sp. (in: cyanobacteria)]
MSNRQSIVRGACFIVASELSFALGAALIKLVSESFPNESIVFFRNFFGLMILAPLLLRNGTKNLQTDCLPIHLVRGVTGITAMYCFFYGIAHLSLGNMMLIKSTIPLIIPFASAVWLQEKISHRVIIAGILGFGGVFLILKPDGDTNWASLVALSGSMMAAISFVTVRKLSATEPTLRIISFFAIFGLSISAFPMIWTWQTPTLRQCLLLIGVGLATTIGQFLLTQGYQNAPASSVGIFTYTSVIFGSFLGWLFWHELLDINYFFGAVLIVLAGSIVLKSKITQ